MLDRITWQSLTATKMRLGALTIGALVLAVILVIALGKLPLGKTRYEAEFAQAAQIRPGDHATIAGISVGTVDGVKLAGDRVIVSFAVRDDVHLGADSRAAIKLTTILGSRYLELSPAGADNLEHHRIPLANTEVPYDLQRTLQDATTTFDQVDADRITKSLTVLAGSLDGLPDALPQALANVRSLAAVISTRREQLTTLLKSADSVTTTMMKQKADLGALVLQGRDLLGQIASRRDALRRLFASATTLVDRIHGVLQDQPAIAKLIAEVGDLAGLLSQHDALIQNLLQTMPVTVRNVTNVFGSSTAVETDTTQGPFIDSWMCALSKRAKEFGFAQYYQDCEPAPDPWPGWPAPQPERLIP